MLLLLLGMVVTTATAPSPAPDDSGLAFAGWVASACFWAGMICVAGHVLRLVLTPGEAARSSARSGDDAAQGSQ